MKSKKIQKPLRWGLLFRAELCHFSLNTLVFDGGKSSLGPWHEHPSFFSQSNLLRESSRSSIRSLFHTQARFPEKRTKIVLFFLSIVIKLWGTGKNNLKLSSRLGFENYTEMVVAKISDLVFDRIGKLRMVYDATTWRDIGDISEAKIHEW